MKVAITADFHLNSAYPERKTTLEKILNSLKKKEIHHLIIAGDLFDKEQQNYSEFDNIANKFSEIHIYVIPGNHDPNISNRFFTASNLKVITTDLDEKIISIGNLNFLFIPYKPGFSTMDEAIDETIRKNTNHMENKIVLISHGDYLSSSYELNLYEEGYYMPLTYRCVEKHKFLKIFLGHIHKPTEYGIIYYPGSPHPLDITETGKRRIIIFDTQTYKVSDEPVETPYIYFDETLITYPVENEFELVKENINNLINCWNLTPDELKKVILRLKVKGYSTHKKKLSDTIFSFLKDKGITLYNNQIDLNELNLATPESQDFSEKIKLFHIVKKEIANRAANLYEIKNRFLNFTDIEEEALKIIFGDIEDKK
ncbi:MAG: metallophosphoesterase [Endomicrobiia bacterium]